MMTVSVKSNKNLFFNEFLDITIYNIFDCVLILVALAPVCLLFQK